MGKRHCVPTNKVKLDCSSCPRSNSLPFHVRTDLASTPTSLSYMNALISFLSTIPEDARLHMTETAVAVLLGDGLEDSASCLMGNMASTSPEESELAEVFYRRSLEIDPRNQITGDHKTGKPPVPQATTLVRSFCFPLAGGSSSCPTFLALRRLNRFDGNGI